MINLGSVDDGSKDYDYNDATTTNVATDASSSIDPTSIPDTVDFEDLHNIEHSLDAELGWESTLSGNNLEPEVDDVIALIRIHMLLVLHFNNAVQMRMKEGG